MGFCLAGKPGVICIDEIERLKSNKVYGNVTFFALLIKTTYSLSYLINNENLVDQRDYKLKYPIYEKMLGRCIQKGIRMNSMLTKCRTVRSIILKFEFDDIVGASVVSSEQCRFTNSVQSVQ